MANGRAVNKDGPRSRLVSPDALNIEGVLLVFCCCYSLHLLLKELQLNQHPKHGSHPLAGLEHAPEVLISSTQASSTTKLMRNLMFLQLPLAPKCGRKRWRVSVILGSLRLLISNKSTRIDVPKSSIYCSSINLHALSERQKIFRFQTWILILLAS